MTYDDDITVVSMKELARLNRVEAAAHALHDVCAERFRNWPGAPRNDAEEELELALIALEIALLAQAQRRDAA